MGWVCPRNPTRPEGKVLHFAADGTPLTAPGFTTDAVPGLWSLGHRNIQGAALDAQGRLWTVEHGAKGGDELNMPQAGRNYGWPVVTHGVDYSGAVISDRRSAPGFEDPLRAWVPSVNPSGIAFYAGAAMPGWRGNLLMASVGQALVRLTIEDGRITGEERLLPRIARFRHVVVSPQGVVHILTDERNGRVLRLDPA